MEIKAKNKERSRLHQPQSELVPLETTEHTNFKLIHRKDKTFPMLAPLSLFLNNDICLKS
jgi:hypothetical protein